MGNRCLGSREACASGMPPHQTLAAQEREAADIFARADRRGPPPDSVVCLSSPSLLKTHVT